jgi:hypothetical protein
MDWDELLFWHAEARRISVGGRRSSGISSLLQQCG